MSGHGHEPFSTKKLVIIFVATFLMGVVVGVILYLQNNTGSEGDGALPTDTRGFSIIAYTYGGCVRGGGCASYKVEQNGVYTYLVRDAALTEIRKEGTLVYQDLDMLREQVEGTDFETLKKTKFRGTCAVTYDGNAYRYDIEYEDMRFTFDTCVEDLSDTPLFLDLENYFTVFQNTSSTE